MKVQQPNFDRTIPQNSRIIVQITLLNKLG
jgi:hypothetical protein